MDTTRRAALLATCMAVVGAGAAAVRPGSRIGRAGPAIDLEAMVPRNFGSWIEQPAAAQVVNPQTQELLDKLYSQIVSRTYANERGYRIMLSLAYGDDQRGSLEAHKPEVCYPAQGFALRSSQDGALATPFGSIPVRRLSTSLGQRQEPLTYWFTVGSNTVQNKLEKRMVELRLALTGQIPDGLLFRVSSIDADPQRAWKIQDQFVTDLLQAADVPARMRLAGLGAA